MASGMGVRGTIGRCYGFFADLKQCQDEVRALPLDSEERKNKGCMKYREDYFECLHNKKEKARVRKVLEEQKKQEYEAKYGVPAH